MTTTLALLGVVLATAGPGPRPAPADTAVQTRYYSFRNDPWINLHHLLYQWARDQEGIGTGRQKVTVVERSDVGSLDPRERRAWDAAVAYYVTRFAKRGEFDGLLLRVKAALVGLGGDPEATPPDDIIRGLARVLTAAMPVYLAHWWPADASRNRAWIESIAPLVRGHEDAWVATAERVYGCTWPSERLRVDASSYADWAGAYTSNHPAHTVVATEDGGGYLGLSGMEIVFHESSHQDVPESALRAHLDSAFSAAGGKAPPRLWHTLIFATAGEAVREMALRDGRPEYVPVAIRGGLINFAGWREAWPAVVAEWIPMVEGKQTPAEGYAALARALTRR